MKHARICSTVCGAAALILLCAMCSMVSYQYRSMLCAIEHGLASAPAEVAFLSAIPFLIGIGLALLLHRFFRKHAKEYGDR